MKKKDFLNSIIYVDKKFISDLYEIKFDISPSTTITSNQGKKAGAGVFNFSAEISAQESKTFSISILEMLIKTMPAISQEDNLIFDSYKRGEPTKYGWVKGGLTTLYVERTKGQEVVATSDHFSLKIDGAKDLKFITTLDYFPSGFDALLKLRETLLDKFYLPVISYVRLLPANDHYENWIAVPLLIIEAKDKNDFFIYQIDFLSLFLD